MKDTREELLRSLPAVDRLLEETPAQEWCAARGRGVVVAALREALGMIRAEILDGQRTAAPSSEEVMEAAAVLLEAGGETLVPVINATGVIVHTNLGRSVLCPQAARRVAEVAECYSSLEMELESGKRGSRQLHVRRLLCELTGAEAAAVFNNNASAIMLALTALAPGREVIVSRGQLVEIGGSFRLPDVMAQSGCRMVEVGCTNRTHLRDYAAALTDQTGALLRVHHSNYRILGFTTEPSAAELAQLAHDRGLLLIDDLGSGALLDLTQFGLLGEPTVQEGVAAGADVLCFSADKLLGGPQAGIIVGTAEALGKITRHPLARALRVDKLTVAALLGTLETWRDPQRARREIPTLRMLTEPVAVVRGRAERLRVKVEPALPQDWRLELLEEDSARTGGGAMPEAPIPTVTLRLSGPDDSAATELARKLRLGRPPIITRVHEHALVLDLRTVFEEQVEELATALGVALHPA